MSNSEYHCFCYNNIAIVNAKFRAFGSDGQKGEEVIVRTEQKEQLALPDATNNQIKIEYYDLPYQDLGCFGPVNSGDEIEVYGVANDFKVTINGQKVAHNPKGCPND